MHIKTYKRLINYMYFINIKMLKVAVFLSTICILTAYASVPLLENSLFLTEQDKYIISTVELTYVQAYATCKRYGYTLAIERSAEDTAAINAAITAAGVTSHSHFIGGVRQTSGVFQSEWIWIETGETIEYSNWYNNDEHTYECLLKLDLASYNLSWLSTDCSTAEYFICQKNDN